MGDSLSLEERERVRIELEGPLVHYKISPHNFTAFHECLAFIVPEICILNLLV